MAHVREKLEASSDMRLVHLEIPLSHRSKLLKVGDLFTTRCGLNLGEFVVRNLSIYSSLAKVLLVTAEEYAVRAV